MSTFYVSSLANIMITNVLLVLFNALYIQVNNVYYITIIMTTAHASSGFAVVW